MAGYRLGKVGDAQEPAFHYADSELISQFNSKLAKSPLDAELHFQFADAAWNKGCYFLANAELHTAQFLGLEHKAIEKLSGDLLLNAPDILALNHNQYYRLHSLANAVIQQSSGERVSVLDVGGGEGELSYFIPNCSYCLAEPRINGISGILLPFENDSFDFVVSCHVLEHIPPADRDQFLDQLLSKARTGLILLNPFRIEGTSEKERLELVIEVTNAEWAKEHLDCALPNISSIESYAERHSLELVFKPNASLTTAISLIFMDYFTAKAGQQEAAEKVNRFFNTHFMGIMDSERYPAAYLVILKKEHKNDRPF